MSRARRRPPTDATVGPPQHLLLFDPERYRQAAVQSFRKYPGDTWLAAVAVWRAWQRETIEWQAARGLVWPMKGFRRQFSAGRPPVAWVMESFGTPPPDWGDDPLRF